MDPSITELTKLIANFGVGIVCLAVIICLHIYNVRVTMPTVAKTAREDLANILSSFREELEKERSSSSSIIQSLATSFREELKEERNQCHADHERMMACIQDNQTQLVRITERQDMLFAAARTNNPNNSTKM